MLSSWPNRVSRRTALACVVALATTAAGCSGTAPGSADSTRIGAPAAAPVVATMSAGTMAMGTMMVDSAMVMLHGFCATQGGVQGPGAPSGERRIELIVDGGAARRATRITVAASSAEAADFTAELTAGSDAHAMCAGPTSTIFIGGTAMFLGAPTLTIKSGTAVSVLARTVHAETLAGPVQVQPGQRGVVLAWGAAAP